MMYYKTNCGGLGSSFRILRNETGPHSIKLTMQSFKFPLEFPIPTINDNIVCEEAILVVVFHEHENMSLIRYRAGLFWETFFWWLRAMI